ncbi:sugar ABC transporter substrate-binding protein [Mycolicibacterium stellerae]|uniref:sugar ABC transporter substrate-binding protein n=1 Tax=Mycolicibacterium stellerae TaxID=2358193 RepID=UPI0013DDC31D|nr:sugar ABC transporter substrate-binding protein [Mycolicibacterium stellerae]
MRSSFRIAIAGMAAMVAAGSMAACGTTDDLAGPAASGDRELVLGYSAPYLKDQFQVAVADAVTAEAKERGITTLQVTDANNDAGQQVTQIQNLIAAGATAIALIPRDSSAIVPALDYAKARGVPVIMLDSAPTSGPAALTIRSSSEGMGQQVCQAMGKQLGGQGTVLELQGDLASIAGKERSEGFLNCMKESFPSIKIVSTPTKWQSDVAGSATATALASTPDLRGIYMASDTAMGTAVLSALNGAGKLVPVGDPRHIALYGIDGGAAALDAIRAGTMDGTVSQPVDLYAKYGVDAVQHVFTGGTFSDGPSDHDSEIRQCCSNESQEDLLPTPMVTKGNVDSKDLWANQ